MYYFPGILWCPCEEHHIAPYDYQTCIHHHWRLDGDDSLAHNNATLLTDSTTFVREGELPSITTRQARKRKSVVMHTRPRLSRLVHVWGGERPWRMTRNDSRHVLFRDRIALGETKRDIWRRLRRLGGG